ncbi:hypothetical protein C8Q75DRAFT_801881 [Abortiporus biennis]|nr:hypothetical protein C8Q75DRAFT_801881 [Abortiporus biennis]
MFSPSPAPKRRTVARPSTPPMAAIKRPRPGGSSKAPSRLGTPARPGQSSHQERLQSVRDDESILSGMDVDEGSDIFERNLRFETVFAKSEELLVSFYAHLPVEVKQILRNADFVRDPYTGDVDTLTGFALVASAETCFVWKYAQALTGTPTCYIFSCPQETTALSLTTPFHALVPYGNSREPGLILMSSSGHIRFWDSLGMGLAGGEHYVSLNLGLQDQELATNLTRADPQTYIVSSSFGRLFRLALTSAGGKYHLSPHQFSRPQSSLSLTRLLPSLWSTEGITPITGNINAVALSESGRDATVRDVWVLIDFHLQRWKMSVEGWEELELQEDIFGAVRSALRGRFQSATRNDLELDWEFLDLKLISADELVLLVSYAGQEENTSMAFDLQPRRIYVVVQLSIGVGEFSVKGVKSVPYQSTSSSGAPMHPRLDVILGGKVIVIQFGDTVTLCARDTEWMDRLELKSSRDRTLGVGVIEGESEVLVLTAGTVMKTIIDTDAVEKFNPRTGRANLIKSTMTQAILYGSYQENPLHFSFPPEIDAEALMYGALQLSQSIMESDTHVIRANSDVQVQMTSRKDRLSFLIKFINDNGVLVKMSQASRQRLATDAEKLYAAHQLWLYHSGLIAQGYTQTVLNEAVFTFMRGAGEGHHEDYIRAFFRLKVQDLGGLFPHIFAIVKRTTHDTRDAPIALTQANSVILTVLQSAVDYRHYNMGVYGIEYPLIRPWTSQPSIIEIVSELFSLTTKFVEDSPADAQPSKTKTEAKGQLPQLASILFNCYNERLQWLSSPLSLDEAGSDAAKTELDERFRHARTEILEILRRDGFAPQAFLLAENYRDFRNLTALCHKETIYPPSENPNADRINTYIQKFKEDFTTELYRWYIEHGEVRAMFAQEHGDYLDKFFSQNRYPSVSWINDLGKGRYFAASASLLSEADRAPELTTKHLMLSIGKLSHLAQLHDKEPTSISEPILDAFHDGLDFVSVHETLIEELRAVLAGQRTRQSLEMQADTVVAAKARTLGDRKALLAVFKQLVKRLLQGKALSIEDITDVLSLKDNDPGVEDYVTALHLLVFAHNIPEARRISQIRSVWRRIYLHDDWDAIRRTLNATDAEVNARFRATALHAALEATLGKRHSYILPPAKVLETPSEIEIASRFPGIPVEEIAALEADYIKESEKIAALNLEEAYERVKDIVSEGEAESWMDTSV